MIICHRTSGCSARTLDQSGSRGRRLRERRRFRSARSRPGLRLEAVDVVDQYRFGGVVGRRIERRRFAGAGRSRRPGRYKLPAPKRAPVPASASFSTGSPVGTTLSVVPSCSGEHVREGRSRCPRLDRRRRRTRSPGPVAKQHGQVVRRRRRRRGCDGPHGHHRHRDRRCRYAAEGVCESDSMHDALIHSRPPMTPGGRLNPRCIEHRTSRCLLHRLASPIMMRRSTRQRSTAGRPALHGGEPGQVRKEAAIAILCKCRGPARHPSLRVSSASMLRCPPPRRSCTSLVHGAPASARAPCLKPIATRK